MEAPQQRSSPFGESQPIYYDVSPKIVWTLRIAGILTIVMVVLAFLFCLIQGVHNKMFYLVACNLIVTSLIGVVNVWWYKRGHLNADKYWYMLVLAAVIIWQCIATDVYVFNLKTEDMGPHTTSEPITTSREHLTSA